jgi:UDP-N-acetylmuramoyl-L-alanyl-D-glutamate--2,6-diaminopimelate ligase
VVVTSDNPRSEDPASIVAHIEQGMGQDRSRWCSVVDRRQAIARVLALAEPGDLVLLVGKGHETYQEVGGQKLDFDDRRVAREEL